MPFDELAKSPSQTFSYLETNHYVLCVETNNKEAAKKEATDICWLLNFALGQRVEWIGAEAKENHDWESELWGNFRGEEKPSVNAPLRNHADGVICRYIERAYPIYLLNEDWWQATLHWCSIALENNLVETSGLIYSMLLDRLTRFVLTTHDFPPQIDPDLKTKLQLNDFIRGLDKLMNSIKIQWTEERTRKIIGTLLQWNTEPDYKIKIKTVFEKLSLPIPEQSLLLNRHTLAHNGLLQSGTDPLQYYRDITKCVTMLMLKMLNYEGKYFIPDIGDCTL